MDHDHVDLQRGGSSNCAFMGASAGARRLRFDVPGRHRNRQHVMGNRGRSRRIADGFVSAAAMLILSLAAMGRYRLKLEDEIDLMPFSHWFESVLSMNPSPDSDPILITIEYTIDPARARDFVSAMQNVQSLHLRDSAYR